MNIIKLAIITLLFSLNALALESIQKPFLWEVTRGEQHFYLFGTMHLSDPQLQTLPQSLKKAIDSSDEVRTEIPMDIGTQMKISTLMMRQDRKRLKDIIPIPLLQRSQTYLSSINPQMRVESFDTMKIWALSTVLVLVENQIQYPTLQPIDSLIYQYAKQQNKTVNGIESATEQIEAMDQFTEKEQIAMLESTLDYLETHSGFIENMKNVYMSGSQKKMIRLILSTMYQNPKYKVLEEKFMKVLLYDRNIRMLQRIESLLKDNPTKTYLFAFGVMHFLGEQSIVDFLQCNGYDVNRVK